MCGRTRFALAAKEVEARAGVEPGRWAGRELYQPCHNFSPGGWAPVLLLGEDGRRSLQTMKWGLVPSYTKDGERPDHYRMFNARSEGLLEPTQSPVFGRLLGRRHCVALLDGFYEWKQDAGGRKQPYYVSFGEGRLMRAAALYDVWKGGEDGPLPTYTIITTAASPRLSWLHDRMPVLLTSDEDVEAWLELGRGGGGGGGGGGKPAKSVMQITVPCNSEELQWHPVTPEMSKQSYSKPDASKDVRKRKGSISSFFKPVSPGGATGGGKKAAAAAAPAGAQQRPAKQGEGAEQPQQQQQQQQQVDQQAKQEDGAEQSPQHPHPAAGGGPAAQPLAGAAGPEGAEGGGRDQRGAAVDGAGGSPPAAKRPRVGAPDHLPLNSA